MEKGSCSGWMLIPPQWLADSAAVAGWLAGWFRRSDWLADSAAVAGWLADSAAVAGWVILPRWLTGWFRRIGWLADSAAVAGWLVPPLWLAGCIRREHETPPQWTCVGIAFHACCPFPQLNPQLSLRFTRLELASAQRFYSCVLSHSELV